MNKKTLGIILIVLAIVVAAFLLKTVFFTDKATTDQEEITTEETVTENTEEPITTTDNTTQEEPVKDEEKTIDDFDELESVFLYVIPDEIEDLLDPVLFDEAITEYCIEEKLIGQGAHEVLTEKLYKLESDGLLVKDVNDGVYLFNLQLSDRDNTIIEVATEGKGYYEFTHY